MTVAAIVIAAALALAVPVALRTGKALHRAAHRADLADPADCPEWCVEERFAELLRNQRGGL